MKLAKLLSITSIVLLCLFYILSISSCKASKGQGEGATHLHGADDGGHQHENIAVTKWSSQLEIFMEYPAPVRGESLEFIIHLTRLKDFKAINSGTIELQFTPKNGKPFAVTHSELLREGIFNPTVFFSQTGTYGFVIRYKGEQIDDAIDIGTITVVEDAHDVPPPQDSGVEEIAFLKEQQWKIDFATDAAKTMMVKPSVHAVAEVLPAPRGQIEITAPVAGILSVKGNNRYPSQGMAVKRGQLIALLAPPMGTNNSWAALQLKFNQSKTQYLRAKELLKKDAISKREFENLERRYLMLKAGFPTGNNKNSNFSLLSPIAGVVTKVSALPGRHIKKGEPLITIIDNTEIHLKVNLYEKDYYQLTQSSGAAIRLPGQAEPLFLTAEQMQFLGQGEVLDARTHTIPLLFSLDNHDKKFKIGQVLQIELYTSLENSAVCVPEQSVYDDDGRKVVFIQMGGETFEKRHIKTRNSYLGWLEVISGIKAGERVVTRGAYLVKLASTSAPIGHGHTH